MEWTPPDIMHLKIQLAKSLMTFGKIFPLTDAIISQNWLFISATLDGATQNSLSFTKSYRE